MVEEIANLRTLIVELRPAALDEYGVAAAIESLAERTAARQGIAVDVHVDLAWERGEEPVRHTPELESTVYRLVQESLTNAVRHAGASRVRIEVTERDGFLDVAVADDGKGFDPGAQATGFGLMGMRERVALAAGELEHPDRRRRHDGPRPAPGTPARRSTRRSATGTPRPGPGPRAGRGRRRRARPRASR